MIEENNDDKKKCTTRDKHIDFRLTEGEYDFIKAKADECGLTFSDYGRRVILGHKPRKRLSD